MNTSEKVELDPTATAAIEWTAQDYTNLLHVIRHLPDDARPFNAMTAGRMRSVFHTVLGLLAENARLREALASLVDDDECQLDHHGNCQTHFLTNPCNVAAVRALLPSVSA